MKYVFTSYVSSPEYDQPDPWLNRIQPFTEILETLSRDHSVISIERINYEGKYNRRGVQYYFIKLKKNVVYFPRRMHRLIRKLRPNVVFVNGLIFPLQIIQLRLVLGRRVKIIVIHRSEKPSFSLRRFMQFQADRCINAYLFSSKEIGSQWVQKGIIKNEKKIAEIMHASSSFHFFPREKALEKTKIIGNPIFLWVGRLDSNKDPLTVIKAFRQFVKHQPSAKMYMIYHNAPLKFEIEEYCIYEGLQDNIIMVGEIVHSDMGDWYNSADFIISGSHYEGGGVAVCEAMSCGCIPIITNIQSFRALTAYGKCGFLFTPGSVEELLSVLLKTGDLNIHLERAKVLQQFKMELSFEAIANKINRLVTSL